MATALVYSYLRFSTIEQRKGDSKRRQDDAAQSWAQRNGYSLDEHLRFADEGRSGYHGTHRSKGKLGSFLASVESGQVPRGSILLVENIDRLSRQEPIDAMETIIFGLIGKGITIQTLAPESTYNRESLRNGRIYELIANINRAYEESKRKSDLSKANWARKRSTLSQGKRIATARCPAWLTLTADRSRYEIIPDKASAVRLIFTLASEGMGISSITARMNNTTPSITKSKHWARSYVASILHDRCVLGEYQACTMQTVPLDPSKPEGPSRRKPVPNGNPIPDYFPAVISEEQWYAVRSAVKGRGESRGRQGDNVASLFKGIIHSARDGSALHISYVNKNTKVLMPYSAINATTSSKLPFVYAPFEESFLRLVKELTPDDLTSKGAPQHAEQLSSLTTKRDEILATIASIQARVMQGRQVDALLDLLTKLDDEHKATLAEIERVKAEMAQEQPQSLTDTQSLIDLLSRTTGEGLISLRLKLRARIGQLVESITVHTYDATPNVRCALVQVYFRSGLVRGMYLLWIRRGRHRSHVAGGGGIVHKAGDSTPYPDLRQYQTDPQVQAWCQQFAETNLPNVIDYLARMDEQMALASKAKDQPAMQAEALQTFFIDKE